MSVSKFDSSPHNSNQQDPLDKWQYRLFKIVLFLIAVWAMWKFLNEHVPVAEGFRRFVHWLGY